MALAAGGGATGVPSVGAAMTVVDKSALPRTASVAAWRILSLVMAYMMYPHGLVDWG